MGRTVKLKCRKCGSIDQYDESRLVYSPAICGCGSRSFDFLATLGEIKEMNPKSTRQKIEIMQAYADGKQVEFKTCESTKNWKDLHRSVEPKWDWNEYEYRIKKVPLEIWVEVTNEGKLPLDSKVFCTKEEGEECIKKYRTTLKIAKFVEVIENE